jgi:hypothetical protein
MEESKTQNELRRWLEAFPTEEVQRELQALEAEAARLEQEIRTRRRLLDLRAEFLGIAEGEDGRVRIRTPNRRVNLPGLQREQVAAQAQEAVRSVAARAVADQQRSLEGLHAALAAESSDSDDAGSREVPASEDRAAPVHLSRADKLMYFLSRYMGETWKLSDINDWLVQEGLLEDTEADRHGLQVTASRLARTGKLERPRQGHYRLAPIPEEGAEG